MTLKDNSFVWRAQNFWNLSQSPDQGPSPQSGSNTRTVTLTRTRDGTRLPGWKRIIDSGGNATTPMTAVWDSYQTKRVTGFSNYTFPGTSSFRKSTYTGDPVTMDVDISRGPKAPTINTSFADSGASAKFYKKLRTMAVQMSGPTFLGELRETLHMLRRPAAALWGKNLGYLDALSKAKRASPKHWTKTISGLWLEHSFGWLPLINDCKDAAEAWKRLTHPDQPRKRIISAGFSDEKDKTSTLSSLDNVSGQSCRGCIDPIVKWEKRAYLIEKAQVRYKGAVYASTEATQWDKWALFGFTPSEFIPTAWELLPWSFLADYFTNIGDILTSVVTDTSNLAYCNRTVIQETRYFGFMTENHAESVRTYFPNGRWSGTGSASQVTWEFKRRVIGRSTGSKPALPRFQFSFDLSDGQLFNVAALLGQARGLHPQNGPRIPFRR